MSNVDRREILRFLGVGCALTPILTATASSWQDTAQAADPEINALVQEVVGHALRIKNDMNGGGSGPMPGDLQVVAGHLRLLDAMIETRGWKRQLRGAQIPDFAELDRATGEISVALAEKLTAAGFPARHDELEQLYFRHRDRFSDRNRARSYQLLRTGSFITVQARELDILATRLRNRDADGSPFRHMGRPGRNWAAGNTQLVVQTVPGPGPFDVASLCEALQNMAFMLSLTAFLLSLIPPLAIIALIEEILSLLLDLWALLAC